MKITAPKTKVLFPSCSSQNSFDFHPDISNIGEIMEIRGKKYCLVGSYENDIGGGPCTTYLTREIPDYLIERQIGEGSHGTVWAGREKDNANNVVCIKIAKPGYESELRQEFRILRSMNHPNIICPEVLFEENDKLCMVLPYYQASAFAIKGKCNTLQIRRFCESIGNAIVHLHRLGYSHNDISLSNILISQNGDFVLSDFSSATKGTYDIDDLKLGCAAMELITGKKFIIFKYHTEKMIEESIDEAGITDEQLRGFLMQRFQSVPNAQWLHNSTNNALKENCSDFSIVERD